MKTKRKPYDKVMLTCECGIKIFGNSKDNAQANLEIHLKSKLHKKQMA